MIEGTKVNSLELEFLFVLRIYINFNYIIVVFTYVYIIRYSFIQHNTFNFVRCP